MRSGRASERAFAQLDFEDFEVVARLDVVRIGQHDTALQTRAHFGDVVLEAAQRRDRRCRDDDVLARETRVEPLADRALERSEEHTSELQSLMRISYAVFCLKNKKNIIHVHI